MNWVMCLILCTTYCHFELLGLTLTALKITQIDVFQAFTFLSYTCVAAPNTMTGYAPSTMTGAFHVGCAEDRPREFRLAGAQTRRRPVHTHVDVSDLAQSQRRLRTTMQTKVSQLYGCLVIHVSHVMFTKFVTLYPIQNYFPIIFQAANEIVPCLIQHIGQWVGV